MDPTLLRPDRTSWTSESAYAWCLALARKHYENFPVASYFVPSHLQYHVAAVYAFARIADDIADEPGMQPQERLGHLHAWETSLLSSLEDGAEVDHPVFVALRETVRTHVLPPSLFTSLLSAFRQDVEKNRYATFEEVRDYCRRSADPIGRIMMRLFGYDDPQLDTLSDAICTALQLTNFWQDFSQDLARDRIYLPGEDLSRFGIPHTREGIVSDETKFRELIAFEIRRTRSLFREGKPLLGLVKSRFSTQLRLTWHGGMRVLEKIERTGYNVVHNRPRLMGIDAAVIGYRTLTHA